MKSKPPLPTSGSSVRAQNSRTFGSIAPTRRGVNTRESSPRWRSWAGGSSMMNTPGGISIPLRMTSSTLPFAELYVFQSTDARWTSSKRLSAKKSYRSL